MVITSLELTNFRNYSHGLIEFGDQKNFLIGSNAQGKTNILEAIYLLCLSRSFRTNFEKEAIRFFQQDYLIKGVFKSDDSTTHTIVFHYSKENGKEISIDRKKLNKASEIIGKFPIVLSSPDEYALTVGPPPGRRKLVDILLSQIYSKYFLYLQDYHRIIRQRNAILSQWKNYGAKTAELLSPWDQGLAEVGSNIIKYRHRFSSLFSEIIKNVYSELVSKNEELTFNYRPNIPVDTPDSLEIVLLNRLLQTRNQEIKRGISLCGPHRDDFTFNIDGQELRKYGSRGQHKTVLISLAIAQFIIIKDQKKESPIILIDDLYSEIDQQRQCQIIDSLNRLGQVFITMTSAIKDEAKRNHDRCFMVRAGQVERLTE